MNVEWLWNWEVDRDQKNSEKHGRKSLDWLEQLVEIWILKSLLVRAQKRVKIMEKKTYIILENVSRHKHTVGRNMDMKFTTGAFPVRNWRKGGTCNAVAKRLATHVLQGCGKQNWKTMNLNFYLRRFLSRVLKSPPSFFLLLIVKCESKEINWRKNCSSKRSQDVLIWEILSLSRLQKMLKLADSLSGTHALERRPRVWLNNLLLIPGKN